MAVLLRSRRELREMLGASPTELDTLERQGVVVPSHRGPDGRTGMYDEIDCSLATVALHGFRIGIRGRALARLVAASRDRAPRLAPGWAGWFAFDGAVVELCRTTSELAELVSSYHSPTALVVVPVNVGGDQ